MQNELSTPRSFQFNVTSQKIRTVLIENNPWFIAKDLCLVLGIVNHKDSIKSLDDDEVGKTYLTDVLGRKQLTNIVNESGLYALIMRSNKQEAKVFRKWVTAEVLPALRKSGYYGGRPAELADFADVRDIPYTFQEVNGYQVRVIPVDGDQWYSLGDLSAAIQSKTTTQQTAKKLNEKRILARKLWIYGSTNPAWYVCHLGAQLILSAARMLRMENQLLLDFRKEDSHD
jgi:prophage antirepressor-like protein